MTEYVRGMTPEAIRNLARNGGGSGFSNIDPEFMAEFNSKMSAVQTELVGLNAYISDNLDKTTQALEKGETLMELRASAEHEVQRLVTTHLANARMAVGNATQMDVISASFISELNGIIDRFPEIQSSSSGYFETVKSLTIDSMTSMSRVNDSLVKYNELLTQQQTIQDSIDDKIEELRASFENLEISSEELAQAINEQLTISEPFRQSQETLSQLSNSLTTLQEAQSNFELTISEPFRQSQETLSQLSNSLTTLQEAQSNFDRNVNALIEDNDIIDNLIYVSKNRTEIGSSLIPVNPGSMHPTWVSETNIFDTSSSSDTNPLGLTGGIYTPLRDKASGYTRLKNTIRVKVLPETTYKMSYWCKYTPPTVADKHVGFGFYFKDQNGNPPAITKTDFIEGPSRHSSDGLISGTRIQSYNPNTWVKCERLIKFAPSVESVSIFSLKMDINNTGSIVSLFDVRFEPVIPTKEAVDKAQTDAILALDEWRKWTDIWKAKEEDINETQTKAILALDEWRKWNNTWTAKQEVLDEAQTKAILALDEWRKWNDIWKTKQEGINKASAFVNKYQAQLLQIHAEWFKDQAAWNNTQIKLNQIGSAIDQYLYDGLAANTRAIRAINTNGSLIQYVNPTIEQLRANEKAKAEGKPAPYAIEWDKAFWQLLCPDTSTTDLPPGGISKVYGTSSLTGFTTTQTTLLDEAKVVIKPNGRYKLTFWAKGSGKTVWYFYDQANRHAAKSVKEILLNSDGTERRDADGKRMYGSNGNSSGWLLNRFTFPDVWTKFAFEVEMKPTTSAGYFRSIYWNYEDNSTAGQWIADVQFDPDIPAQADVNEALFKAVTATRDALTANNKGDQARNRAILANTRAIETATNGVAGFPYRNDWTDDQYQNGLVDPLAQKWSTNATKLTTKDIYGRTLYRFSDRFSEDLLTSLDEEDWIEVKPNVDYEFEIWCNIQAKAELYVMFQLKLNDGTTVFNDSANAAIRGFISNNMDIRESPTYTRTSDANGIQSIKVTTHEDGTIYHGPVMITSASRANNISEGPLKAKIMFRNLKTRYVRLAGIDVTAGKPVDISYMALRPYVPKQEYIDMVQHVAITNNKNAINALNYTTQLLSWTDEIQKNSIKNLDALLSWTRNMAYHAFETHHYSAPALAMFSGRSARAASDRVFKMLMTEKTFASGNKNVEFLIKGTWSGTFTLILVDDQGKVDVRVRGVKDGAFQPTANQPGSSANTIESHYSNRVLHYGLAIISADTSPSGYNHLAEHIRLRDLTPAQIGITNSNPPKPTKPAVIK